MGDKAEIEVGVFERAIVPLLQGVLLQNEVRKLKLRYFVMSLHMWHMTHSSVCCDICLVETHDRGRILLIDLSTEWVKKIFENILGKCTQVHPKSRSKTCTHTHTHKHTHIHTHPYCRRRRHTRAATAAAAREAHELNMREHVPPRLLVFFLGSHSLICVTWPMHMFDTMYSYMWHGLFICVSWLSILSVAHTDSLIFVLLTLTQSCV